MANQMHDLDQLQFEDRIDWVDQNEDDLDIQVGKAKKPFLFAAALMAYRKAQAGIATGHMVGLDATASGTQMLSLLIGCLIGAQNSGLIGQTRMNVYKIATDIMNRLLDSDLEYDMKAVKNAFMTVLYGSIAEPIKAFGEDTPELAAFHEAKLEAAPGAAMLVNINVDAWQPNALEHCCTMPDGFEARIKVYCKEDVGIEVDELDHAKFVYRYDVNKGKEQGVALAAHIAHLTDGFVARELERRCNYSVKQLELAQKLIQKELQIPEVYSIQTPVIEELWDRHEFMSLVGIESIHSSTIGSFSHMYLNGLLVLIQDTLNNKSFPVVIVHDDFRSHPNNCNRVRRVYIDTTAEIAESDMLNQMLYDITGENPQIEKLHQNLGDMIRESEYGIC